MRNVHGVEWRRVRERRKEERVGSRWIVRLRWMKTCRRVRRCRNWIGEKDWGRWYGKREARGGSPDGLRK